MISARLKRVQEHSSRVNMWGCTLRRTSQATSCPGLAQEVARDAMRRDGREAGLDIFVQKYDRKSSDLKEVLNQRDERR